MLQFGDNQRSNQAKNILLAEDCEDAQLLISQMLVKTGARVTCVSNGKECIDAALSAYKNDSPFDLIVMDINMPVMDGHAAAQRLRQQGYDMPILAMTAGSTPADEEKCLVAGCDAHVSKLKGPKALLDALRHHLTHKQPVKRSVELPLLPVIPKQVRENPDYANSVLKYIQDLPAIREKFTYAVAQRDFEALKKINLELVPLAMFGYTLFASFLSILQVATESRDMKIINEISPQLLRSIKEIVVSKASLEQLLNSQPRSLPV